MWFQASFSVLKNTVVYTMKMVMVSASCNTLLL